MSKKNKWTIVPFMAVASLIIILFYFLIYKKPSNVAEPLKAIPVNAALIIKINDFNALFAKTSRDNAIWNELKTIPGFSRIDMQMQFIDSLAHINPDIAEILDNPPSFLSAHYTGKDKISVMHVFQLPPRVQEKKIKELINGMVIHSGTIKTRQYEGIDLHEVALLNHRILNNFYYAIYHDILMISFSATVIEDAIRQLSLGESLTDIKGFSRIYETAGKNVDANLFINFQQFPRSISAFVRTEFKSEVRSFRNFADWAELDLNLLSDMVLMNGFIDPADSLMSLASVFMNQTPQRISCDEILPSTVSSFVSIAISDADRYFRDYKDYLEEQGLVTSYTNTLKSINNAYGTSFPGELTDLLDHEIALGFDNGNNPDSAATGVYFLMKIKSKSQAEEVMNAILKKMATTESMPVSSFTTQYKLDADLSFTIFHLPVRRLTSKIFGNLFSVLDEHYYVILDNYLVFSGSVESLKYLIHNYVLNKTLKNESAYKEFKNSLSSRFNVCFYCNLSRGAQLYSAYLNKSIGEAWRKNSSVFQKIQVLGLQLYANNNMLYSNFLVRYLSDFDKSAQTVWESKLDTLVNFKPVFVVNHQTGQNEVFVQDLNNNIYLINQAGRILWKIQIMEPINSEVFQVDYFHNGKLQLLFSTRSEIYLVDRKGNFVEKYPIKLRSPATCGVSVFDYDNTRDYRLFIACEDKHIYAYNREGTLVPGWNFTQSENTVNQPINHFRIGDKDFLVFGDGYRTYILDRKGNTRLETDAYFPRSVNNNYLLDKPADGSSPSIVTTDTTGKVYFLSFTGSVKTAELPGKFSGRHFFDYKDLNGDGKAEYIYMDNNKLTVYNHDNARLFTHKFDDAVTSPPMYYQFSATDRKLGVVSREENRIYLFNNDGSLYEGFPLQGNTPFSIGQFGDSLSRFNLVVGSKDNFLYNYRVK